MKELIAFILPPATALAGMCLSRLILGEKFETRFGIGFKFAFGLAVGMLVFSQAVLLGALAGINAAAFLAWLAIIWGGAEAVLLAMKSPTAWKSLKFRPGHLWLLLLLPLLYSWWVFGRLSTLEGTLEFDANAFWVFKAKIFYLEQGKNLIDVLHQSNLSYAHMDYPLLVPCLYTLGYGAVGGVDEFINKVWPFWMMVALAVGILSLARILKNPRPLPIAVATLIAFLPASLQFIRNEGGTIPMVFYTSLAALLIVTIISGENELAPAAVLALAGCAMTKFEGIAYAAICFCALLPFCLRRGWLKNKFFWKSAIAAAVCLLPYFFLRLTKPIPHPESHWLQAGMAAPHAVLHRFPQTWFINVCSRFFSPEFFHWQTTDNEHLQWIGQWNGLGSLVNEQLSILPWLLLVLLIFSMACKPRSRPALGTLAAIVLGVLTFLALAIDCLQRSQKDLSGIITFGCDTVGRYYYPFFIAWFLGTAAVWFADEKKSSAQTIEPEKNSSLVPPQNPKRRH